MPGLVCTTGSKPSSVDATVLLKEHGLNADHAVQTLYVQIEGSSASPSIGFTLLLANLAAFMYAIVIGQNIEIGTCKSSHAQYFATFRELTLIQSITVSRSTTSNSSRMIEAMRPCLLLLSHNVPVDSCPKK
jgi:hypothetical protein